MCIEIFKKLLQKAIFESNAYDHLQSRKDRFTNQAMINAAYLHMNAYACT